MQEIRFAWVCRNIKFNTIERVELSDVKLINRDLPLWIIYGNCEIIAKIRPTGLLDKSGKEVYEGDLVAVYDGGYCLGTFRVEWDKADFKYILADWENERTIHCFDLGEFSGSEDDIEIIGNIYENREIKP